MNEIGEKYEVRVPAHKSIYCVSTQDCEPRMLDVYFSLPEQGVNKETGILLLIAGFGFQAESPVYAMAREQLAVEHNMVVVQCDYFGYEFLQTDCEAHITEPVVRSLFSEHDSQQILRAGSVDFELFWQTAAKLTVDVAIPPQLKESAEYCNDCGLMQAVDNITAVLHVINILYDNDQVFNPQKIIIFGQGHGAYLGHLCNLFAPGFFSLLVDESGYLKPWRQRVEPLRFGREQFFLTVVSEPFAWRKIIEPEMLDLAALYSKSRHDRQCVIMAYHSPADLYETAANKKSFCLRLASCEFFTVEKPQNDLLQLYRHAMNNCRTSFKTGGKLRLPETVEFAPAEYKYRFDYSEILPQVGRQTLHEYLYDESAKIDYASPGIRRIRIELASACNLRCTYCPTGTDYANERVPRQLMQEETFDRIVEEIGSYPTLSRATLYIGGEPLLNKKLLDYMKVLAKKTTVQRMDFVTNGMLLTEKFCRSLCELGDIDLEITVSLDGKVAGENDRVRLGSDYEKIKKNIFMLRKLAPKTVSVLIANVQVATAAELETEVQVPEFMRQDFAELLSQQYGTFQIDSFFAQVWPGLDEKKIQEQGLRKRKVLRPRLCTAASSEISIRANGDVVPCCYDLSSEYVLGNVCTESLTGILNSSAYRELRKALHHIRETNEVSTIPILCKKCVTVTGEMLYK